MADPTWWGATLEDVRGLLPTRQITDTSIPTEDQVEGFMDQVTGWTEVIMGDLDRFTDEFTDRIIAMARGLVALGAGAWTDDAGHPETTEPGASNYGSRLWLRYDQGLDDLREAIADEIASGRTITPDGSSTGGGVSAPPPAFTSRMRF